LYYVGAALHMADGGDFSNPLIARQAYPGLHHYFGHPPLYSYVLAGWLKIFGVSASALRGFQLLMYLLVSWFTLEVFRKLALPSWLNWLVPFVVACSFMNIGLRFEPMSVALTMGGFALVLQRRSGLPWFFLAFLLMLLGGSTASRITFFSGALCIFSLVELQRSGIPLLKLSVVAALAVLVAFAIFLVMIQFHFGEFMQSYLVATHGRSGGSRWLGLKHYLFNIQGVTWLPVHVLWLLALPVLWRFRTSPAARLGITLVIPVVVLVGMAALNDGAIWYITLTVMLATALVFQNRTGKLLGSWLLPIALSCAIIITNFRYGLTLAAIVLDKVSSTPVENSDAFRAFRPQSGQTVLIDYQTACYLFDYRIPSGFLSWEFSSPFPGSLALETPPHPGDLYLIGPGMVDLLNKKNLTHIELPRWRPFGNDRWAPFRNPRTAYWIDPNSPGQPGPGR